MSESSKFDLPATILMRRFDLPATICARRTDDGRIVIESSIALTPQLARVWGLHLIELAGHADAVQAEKEAAA